MYTYLVDQTAAIDVSGQLEREFGCSFYPVHSRVLEYSPSSLSTVLDIDSGSGRDAAYLVTQGHRVVAVEPTMEMREGGLGNFMIHQILR